MKDETETTGVIEQYMQYIENNVKKSFDFNTWHQHQFGSAPSGILVEPKIDFCVTSAKAEHK